MRPASTLVRWSLCAALATLGSAADVCLRAGYEHPDEHYRLLATSPEGSSWLGQDSAEHTEVQGRWDRDDRVTVGALVTHGTWLIGGSLFYQQARDESDGLRLDNLMGTVGLYVEPIATRMRRYGTRGEAGATLPLTSWLRIEALPFVGVGHSAIDLHTPDGRTTFSGYTIEAGGNLDLVVVAGPRFECGLGVGFLYAESRADDSSWFDWSTNVDSVTVHEHGVVYRFFIGLKQ